MLPLRTGLRTLAVICLMMSLTACGSLQPKPTLDERVVVCPQSAFIDTDKYAVPPLKSKSDREYHQWVADYYLRPLPEVLRAYIDLRECWDTYTK